MVSFFLLSLFPLLFFALIAILNTLTFPRLKPDFSEFTALEAAAPLPALSILLPMRNESGVIAETVRSLLAQDYPNLEILILDDYSTDESVEIARAAANGDPRLRILPGKPLPTGWIGKMWACHQLSEQAKGDYLLFTDADVRWMPGAALALMVEAQRTKADLLTVWPTQMTHTWGERLVVPLMAFSILAYLPVLAVHYLPWPVFSAAIGQGLLFRRAAYRQIGGHAANKDKVLDDMAFAYSIKRHKLRLRMADANGLIQTRMYSNWLQVRDGFAKNILAGHGNNVLFLLLSTVFHWWLFVIPWFLLVLTMLSAPESSLLSPCSPMTVHGLRLVEYCILIAISILTRALTAAASRQRIRDSLLLPVSVFLMTLIALRAIQWRFSGGSYWKDRQITV